MTKTALKLMLLQRDGNDCVYCYKVLKSEKHHVNCAGRTTIDHVIPKSLGGKDNLNNMVPACHRCNTDKRNSLPLNFIWEKSIRGNMYRRPS